MQAERPVEHTKAGPTDGSLPQPTLLQLTLQLLYCNGSFSRKHFTSVYALGYLPLLGRSVDNSSLCLVRSRGPSELWFAPTALRAAVGIGMSICWAPRILC